MKQDMIVILDLGSTENTVIARQIRDMGVYSEIHPHDITPEQIKKFDNVKGIILNGGVNRVVDGTPVDVCEEIYKLGYPVMAIDHPTAKCEEVHDQIPGEDVLKAFLFDTCKAEANWNMKNFVEDQVELIRKQVGDKKVLLALSGGVDSSVVAALLIKAIGKQLVCVHVNHGLMRKGESESVVEVFKNQMDANLIYVDASERFLGKLAGVADPEEKRKIIGAEFIRVFEEEARKLEGIDFLAQGTIYPDIVESGTKTAKVVKSHHNVGGLPEDLQFDLVEPLYYLFKDEVRACGIELGLPHGMVYRQPFPGPGLGIRIIGEVTAEKVRIVQDADYIYREEVDAAVEEYRKEHGEAPEWMPNQYFAALTNMRSVGVMGDERTYDYAVALRAVNTVDFMTAEAANIPFEVLQRVMSRIINEVKGVNRCFYDITSKPPGTIEFE